jgi:GTP-binding protein
MSGISLRNVAIIAHVDHGKTTLVDCMLRQSGNFREGELGGDLIMDSNPQERERGITILAKNCAIRWKRPTDGADFKINIIDTPGHADFGGEVERVLKMADGCALLVDAFEGPMPQTRFVLQKAFAYKLRPIVIVNKIDRPDARISEVLDEIFDLFIDMGADDKMLDFPVLYCSGKHGFARRDPEDGGKDMAPLFETIVDHVPPPTDDPNETLQMLVTTLDYNDYVGLIGVGRVLAGEISVGQTVTVIEHRGHQRKATVGELYGFEGLGRIKVKSAHAGDIVAVVGIDEIGIGDTLTDPDNPRPAPIIPIDEPTLSMTFQVNDSPFAGKEGKYLTSRHIRDRLMKELQHNVALRVEDTPSRDTFRVSGRGLLHLGVLIETMRREGFELQVGKPRVIYHEMDGHKTEPIEYLVVDVPMAHQGAVMELVGSRRADLVKMDIVRDITHLEFTIPARGLIGLRTRILNATRGEAIMHHNFYQYQKLRGSIPGRQAGVMIAHESGRVTAFALENLADRGVMFVKPGDYVYAGQVVGEHCKDDDIDVNVCKEKKLTNMRAASADKTVVLKPPRDLSLEVALEYIAEDELVEVTPTADRIRKRALSPHERKKAAREART